MPGIPNIKKGYQGQPGTSVGTIYTAPANTSNQLSPYATSIIKTITITNTTSSVANVTVGINGVAAANQIVPNVSIPANDTVMMNFDHLYLSASDTVQALQGSTGAITVYVGVVEVQ